MEVLLHETILVCRRVSLYVDMYACDLGFRR